jgi:NitT/TauT family transport system substrate-binding protein
LVAFTFAAVGNAAADSIRIAVQKTGTLAWELDVIRTHGLDRKRDLDIATIELASTEAGKIALKGGSADLMLSDWLWVARERSLGDALVFYPSSSLLGAVMAPAHTAIRGIAGLKGRKLAVAGRSTRAGCCCRRWRAAAASTSRRRRPSSMARRRCFRRKRCRAKPTPR